MTIHWAESPLVSRAGPVPLELGPPRRISYLRISVTDRCNLRCQYCMPEEQQFLERSELLSFEEIATVAAVLVRHGVDKIRLTGGEPLLRRDIERLVALLAGLPGAPRVVLTTNGLLLARHARGLRAAGLQRLNVSLDTLRPERFERLARRPGLQQVLAGLDAAAQAGFTGTKLNMVVMGGVNDDELPDMLEFARARGLQARFIEFMPLQSNEYGLRARRVTLDEILRRLQAVTPLEPLGAEMRGSDPAALYRVRGSDQVLGLIAAISQPFCESCNRVRLTAEGALRSCLFEGGEVDVRALVRGESGLEQGLVQALDWLRRIKPAVHAGYGHVQMNQVGG